MFPWWLFWHTWGILIKDKTTNGLFLRLSIVDQAPIVISITKASVGRSLPRGDWFQHEWSACSILIHPSNRSIRVELKCVDQLSHALHAACLYRSSWMFDAIICQQEGSGLQQGMVKSQMSSDSTARWCLWTRTEKQNPPVRTCHLSNRF